jgi:predicted transcriptional regulator
MNAPDAPRPSESEWVILHVLWERGPIPVREVHDRIGQARGTGYTTVLKLMQIMVAKGWSAGMSRGGRTFIIPCSTGPSRSGGWSRTCSIGRLEARVETW